MAKTEVTVEITSIGSIEQKTDKFRVQNIIGKETSSQWDNFIAMQAVNDNIDKISYLKVGSVAMFECYINGRMWNDKVITNLNINKVSVIGHPNEAGQDEQKVKEVAEDPMVWDGTDDNDDLPF